MKQLILVIGSKTDSSAVIMLPASLTKSEIKHLFESVGKEYLNADTENVETQSLVFGEEDLAPMINSPKFDPKFTTLVGLIEAFSDVDHPRMWITKFWGQYATNPDIPRILTLVREIGVNKQVEDYLSGYSLGFIYTLALNSKPNYF